MDTAKALIRMFSRAFYETKHILAIEALMTHSALHVEDLAHVLNMNPKEVRKMCHPLKEDRLISSQIRPEIRAGQARPSNRELYFINFHLAINAIKFKIMKILQKAKADYDPTQERKEYVCSRCKYEGTEQDVLSHFLRRGAQEFLCPNCDFPIDRPENTAEDAGGSAQMSRINDNLKPFVEVLKVIDGIDVPENNFDEAIERQKPIERSELAPAADWTAVIKDKGNGAAGGVKGEQQKIQVELTNAEQNEEREHKKKLEHAQQQAANALPVWYTQSTVTGKAVLADDSAKLAGALAAEAANKKDQKSTEEENEHVRAYYEELRRAEEEEARKAAEEDGEEEDEDDDGGDFEDVNVSNTNVGTPASTPSVSAGVKRERDSDDDDDDDEFEDVDVKRVKKEEDDDEED